MRREDQAPTGTVARMIGFYPDDHDRFLRHRTANRIFRLGDHNQLECRPSDDHARRSLSALLESEPLDPEDEAGDWLSDFLLVDCRDLHPIAYSPPHRFGQFWIVPMLWIQRVGDSLVLYAPYPHTATTRPHHVLRVNRGKQVTTLERDDSFMIVLAPPLEVIEFEGLSHREDDGFSLGHGPR